MRPQDSIQVLLRVRSQREKIEERKLTAIIEKLNLAQAELVRLSTEIEQITTTRVTGIQLLVPNVHHQAMEIHSAELWRRYADRAAEVESLQGLRKRQMSAYLSAHREREVAESLDNRRNDLYASRRRLAEQKLNEDLFLARRFQDRTHEM